MSIENIFNSDIFKWVILPILIFTARLVDVSLGTIRIIFISRGLKYIAPIIAFFEINIWLIAISQIILNLNNPLYSISYASGFALGNFIGILIEEKLSLGTVMIRIIIKHDSDKIIECLRCKKYGVTAIDAKGNNGDVKIIFAVIRRSDLKNILDDIKHIHPQAFYTVEDVRTVEKAIFPMNKPRGFLRFYRKGK